MSELITEATNENGSFEPWCNDDKNAPVEIYMRRIQAGEYLKSHYGFCSASLLSKLASIGGGPLYSKVGRLNLYRKTDLDRWALAKIGPARRSTSDEIATLKVD